MIVFSGVISRFYEHLYFYIDAVDDDWDLDETNSQLTNRTQAFMTRVGNHILDQALLMTVDDTY